MVVRRAVYRLLFPLAVVLPVWLFIGRGIIVDGTGWGILGYLFLCPILFVALLVVSGIMRFRPGARAETAVTLADAAVMIALWVSLIVAGLVSHAAVLTIAVLLLIGAFWLAVWEFVTHGKRRVQEVMDDIDATTRGARASNPYMPPQQPLTQQTIDIGEVIVVTSEDVSPPRRTPDPAP